MEKVSIQLVSPASGETPATDPFVLNVTIGFHSISFPSEWGGLRKLKWLQLIAVSIQLVSPASGENVLPTSYFLLWMLMFPFN